MTSLDDPSGAAAAAEAHAAGAVVPALEEPVHRVTLEFRVHAPLAEALELTRALEAQLLEHPLVVQPFTLSVLEPGEVAA